MHPLVAAQTEDQPTAAVKGLGVPVLLSRPVRRDDVGPAPYRYDFPDLESYEQAWHLWRAMTRDGWMTDAELDAQLEVRIVWVRAGWR